MVTGVAGGGHRPCRKHTAKVPENAIFTGKTAKTQQRAGKVNMA